MTISRRALTMSAGMTPLFSAPSIPQAVSLAAWSFSQSFFQGKWKLVELPGILRNKLGIDRLEHVNQFFDNPMLPHLQKLKKACSDNGVRSTILMVDSEGNTASPNAAERKLAAVSHRKWMDIAQYLGCESMRINVRGGAEDWKTDPDLASRAAETIHMMIDYAKGSGVSVIVENHGGASSDPDVLVAIVKKVNHPQFGLLCDLGNWNKGDDRYANVKKILPHARGLSVKGTWGADIDPAFDCERLVKTALDGGYSGNWGLEVTPRSARGVKMPVEELFAKEVETVLGA
ncbi:MAG: TIM barrel protein, partial [Acidobacteria bacterium]|nr:TIM barrel protein [Acidobacteriota bacterium]